ncbi:MULTISPECIES: YaiA family protein [unclassified Serratia (in: enterobacteria)]|uniref:YaiA family protein n=1 Tax=unclassified Serratia (in: enterobacteria) TaxID=2647522 RepID=UPI002ED134C5|nr:YaiA family protein [Serratia sp. C2(2)]MEE4447952.1 YaiA family protein [Serratia sp. C2(1)]
MRENNRPGYPRTARIVEVDRGDPSLHMHRFEVRTDDIEPNTLLSEHATEQEALDAKHRYEDPALED